MDTRIAPCERQKGDPFSHWQTETGHILAQKARTIFFYLRKERILIYGTYIFIIQSNAPNKKQECYYNFDSKIV